jgi:hypothetical protein
MAVAEGAHMTDDSKPPLDRQERNADWAYAMSAAATKLTAANSLFNRVQWHRLRERSTWGPILALAVGAWLVIALVALCGRAEGTPITQADFSLVNQAAEQSLTSANQGLNPAQSANLARAVTLMSLALLGEALAGVLSIVAIHEAAAIAATVGPAIAAGGLSAVAGITVATVAAFSFVVAVATAVGIAYVLAPKVAEGLRQNHPAGPRGSIGSGEQTDDMHQAIQQAINPQGALTIFGSIDADGNLTSMTFGGRGNDPAVVTIDESGNMTPISEPNPPNTSQTIDLDPNLDPSTGPSPIDVNPPSDSAPAPDAGGVGDVGDVGDVGLMMAFEPNTVPMNGVGVPAIPTLLMFGLGAWALRRRRV